MFDGTSLAAVWFSSATQTLLTRRLLAYFLSGAYMVRIGGGEDIGAVTRDIYAEGYSHNHRRRRGHRLPFDAEGCD